MRHEPSDRSAADAPTAASDGRSYRESAAGTHPRTPDEPPGLRSGVFSDPDFRPPMDCDGGPAAHNNGRGG